MDKDCGRNPAISYMVRIHGSRAQRNRKFLKKNSPFHPMIPVQQDEFIPAPMVLRERADQGHAVEQPALLDHPVGYPTTAQQPAAEQPVRPVHPVDQPTHVQPTAPAPQTEYTAPPQLLTIPGPALPAIPAQVSPTAAHHRQQPVAAPGQDVLAQLRLREAMGHVLATLMGYAITPTNI